MTKEQILANLDYASSIAKDGANTPLLGGPIALMWGCLVVPTLIIHGLILNGTIDIPINNVGFIWMVYGIIGAILSVMLGRRMSRKPGATSALNKVASGLGISLSILIFAFAITTAITVISQGLPLYLFNYIIVFAFALMTMNLAVLAHISRLPYLRNAAIMAGAFMVITLLMVTQNAVYFVAAGGVIATQIFPSLIEIRNERNNG